MRDNGKIAIGVVLLVLVFAAALEAVTHSDFYKDLQWLNMDNHQH